MEETENSLLMKLEASNRRYKLIQKSKIKIELILKKRIYIKTFGCQMNVYDSDRMADLVNNNYSLVKTPEVADAILINTCHIREKQLKKFILKLVNMHI